jgi:two-component system phosphate regulon sensor histidine kinase PhoR
VTHELLTPLTTIKSYNEMLMDGEIHDEETQKEFLNTIMQETERLQNLIQNLLHISKIEMGTLSLHKSHVRGDALVKDCVTAVETAARKKHIAFESHLPEKSPNFFGDKELLKVAIINILGNAVKYTPEYGKVVFSFQEENGTAVFEVADTGHGISEEDLPHIFEKFYRSKHEDIVRQNGTGLGLNLTRQIVALHGGEIEASSELQKGTQFVIRIPMEEYYLGKQ